MTNYFDLEEEIFLDITCMVICLVHTGTLAFAKELRTEPSSMMKRDCTFCFVHHVVILGIAQNKVKFYL